MSFHIINNIFLLDSLVKKYTYINKMLRVIWVEVWPNIYLKVAMF